MNELVLQIEPVHPFYIITCWQMAGGRIDRKQFGEERERWKENVVAR